MRRIAIFIFSLMIVLGYLGMGMAQEGAPPAQEKPADRPVEKGGESKTDKKVRSTRVFGEVTGVDTQAKTIKVKTKKEEVTLSVSDKTKIMSGRTKKELAEIKSGDRITAAVNLMENGAMIARFIRVSTPKGTGGGANGGGAKGDGEKELPKAEKAPEDNP
jgi:transcription antitermination factor NusG